ncbi:MAG: YciI family protein [Actinophytocola sp.]|uniref:YciI family protein n=1 Tax=Actinophytocola sp. TaxID=1872138 RepID=UPI00132BE2E9|nr:YciI family protein [Actinophytocola sp.]MPZ82717.1 YciI family protein [Actinophytocola sp.]
MRFMIMVKGGEDYEAGEMADEEVLTAMGRYNEELVKAGVMLDGNGLLPTAKGALVSFSGGEPTVVDGPFAEAKEVVGGYWVFEVKSREEAIEWVKRIPSDPSVESVIEIRQFFEGDDFGETFTDEIRERTERMQATVTERRHS